MTKTRKYINKNLTRKTKKQTAGVLGLKTPFKGTLDKLGAKVRSGVRRLKLRRSKTPQLSNDVMKNPNLTSIDKTTPPNNVKTDAHTIFNQSFQQPPIIITIDNKTVYFNEIMFYSIQTLINNEPLLYDILNKEVEKAITNSTPISGNYIISNWSSLGLTDQNTLYIIIKNSNTTSSSFTIMYLHKNDYYAKRLNNYEQIAGNILENLKTYDNIENKHVKIYYLTTESVSVESDSPGQSLSPQRNNTQPRQRTRKLPQRPTSQISPPSQQQTQRTSGQEQQQKTQERTLPTVTPSLLSKIQKLQLPSPKPTTNNEYKNFLKKYKDGSDLFNTLNVKSLLFLKFNGNDINKNRYNDIKANYATLIKLKGDDEVKELYTIPHKYTHIHYKSWPDHGVPVLFNGLHNIIEMLFKNKNEYSNYKIIVHCSAGVGRTGTFIMMCYLYYNIMIKNNNITLDNINNAILFMRSNRNNKMVQSYIQYEYIINYAIHLNNLKSNSISSDSVVDAKDNMYYYIDNEGINNYSTLYNKIKVKKDTYINANYISNCIYNPFNFFGKIIATQGPTEYTVDDFNKMIVQEEITHVIMVTNLIEYGKNKCIDYFDATYSKTFKNVKVSITKNDDYDIANCKITFTEPKPESRITE